MQFALLYHDDPAQSGPNEGEVADWMTFDGEIKAAGAHVYEAGIEPVTRARTLTVHDGQGTTASGPVVGTGDVLAGFWLIDVPDAEAVAAWARRIPTATYGKAEVRPIVEFPAS